MQCCCRYVEDHANKLVRTFTGNLTAMLHTVNTIRPSFDIRRFGQRSSSTGGSGSSAKSSRFAPRDPSRTTTGGIGLGAGPAITAMALGATRFATEAGMSPRAQSSAGARGQGLASTMSLPIRRKSAKGKWIKSVLDSSSNDISAGTNNKKHGTAAPAGGQGHNSALHLSKGIRLGRRNSSREGRRSSGSGTPVRKVVTMKDGVEVMQLNGGTSIPEGHENSQSAA